MKPLVVPIALLVVGGIVIGGALMSYTPWLWIVGVTLGASIVGVGVELTVSEYKFAVRSAEEEARRRRPPSNSDAW